MNLKSKTNFMMLSNFFEIERGLTLDASMIFALHFSTIFSEKLSSEPDDVSSY